MSTVVEARRQTGKAAAIGVVRQLWRLLPLRVRLQLFFSATRLLAPLPDRMPAVGFPLAIAGMFSSASGVGEGARLAYAALDANGYAPAAFDLSAAFGQKEFSSSELRRPMSPGGGSLIVHHNGPYVPHALWTLGTSLIRRRKVIGYWAWELPRLPKDWHSSFRYVHEIWAPSSFTRDAIAAATRLPVHVVPHPMLLSPFTPNMREQLGLPSDTLVVLNAFHLGSAYSRKNPLAAVAAFRRAFGDANDKILLIKTINSSARHGRQELEAAIQGCGNIRLIESTLSEMDMAGLFAASDIVISLHRSEGFGLVPAQAMRMGKPVVATNWSGNLEFMNENNSALVAYSLIPVRDPEGSFDADGQMWADADVDHAAEWLRRLAASAELRGRLGTTAAADTNALLSPERFARRVGELIGASA